MSEGGMAWLIKECNEAIRRSEESQPYYAPVISARDVLMVLDARAAEPDGRVHRALGRLIEAINGVNARTGASEMSCVFCRAVGLSLAHAETCPLYEAEDALRWAEPDGLREALRVIWERAQDTIELKVALADIYATADRALGVADKCATCKGYGRLATFPVPTATACPACGGSGVADRQPDPYEYEGYGHAMRDTERVADSPPEETSR